MTIFGLRAVNRKIGCCMVENDPIDTFGYGFTLHDIGHWQISAICSGPNT